MLFNSYVFIFLFLPVTVLIFHALRITGLARTAILMLVIASFIFYAWWNVKYVFLLMALMAVNFAIARQIVRHRSDRRQQARLYLVLGLMVNLLTLGYYKYANFFIDNVDALLGVNVVLAPIILPLGISFFTFQKIAFLVDSYQGKVRRLNAVDYSLFVMFFPQLIAGPIVHHSEVIPQFANLPKITWHDFIQGITIFIIGLSKKTLIADTAALYASPHFDAVASGSHLDFLTAWGAALAYTTQLYFDFSGYSDMAIGIGLLFGIRLPVNFNSPYKSQNIIEFWRRWHITLSRFLRDYLYIPLGGNRKGAARRQANLFITMLLGGIWHGAGWTFLVWGALHGFYLVMNHTWQALHKKHFPQMRAGRLTNVLAWTVTFLCIVVGWVFFRAATVATASDMLYSMGGFRGLDLARFSWAGTGLGLVITIFFLSIAVILPNTQQIIAYVPPGDIALTKTTHERIPLILRWRPTYSWAAYAGVLLALCLMAMTRVSEFIYFQF